MNEKEFVDKAREVLDEGARGLSPEVSHRLDAIRERALGELSSRKPRRARLRFGLPLPVAGAVIAAVLVLVSLVYMAGLEEASLRDNLADFDILATTTQLELLEDLDFYRWLDEKGYDKG